MGIVEKVNTYQVEFDRVKNIKKEYDKNLSLPKENKEKGKKQMVNFIINGSVPTVMFLGILFAFFATCFCTAKFHPLLPKDIGRDFAHDGKLSAGKPRGAGFIFILVFAASGLIFARLSGELVIYIILVVAAMMMGFLDDASKVPWGEYKKGISGFCDCGYGGGNVFKTIILIKWRL